MAEKAKKDAKDDYESQMAELEDIVKKISAQNCSLTESMNLYARGVELCSSLKKHLDDIDGKIKILNEQTNQFEDLES